MSISTPLHAHRTRIATTFSLFLRVGVAWAYLMVIASVARGSLWLLASDYWPKPIAFDELAQVFLQGSRLDSSAIGHLLIPTMIATVLAIWINVAVGLANALRRVTAGVLLVAIPILMLATLYNFQELQDTFSYASFEIFHGNFIDVITLAHRKHNLFLGFAIVSTLAIVGFRIYLRIEKRAEFPVERVPHREWVSIVSVLIAIAVYIFLTRGSLGRQPACRDDAGVSEHAILNVCAMNPIVALKYAYRDYSSLTSGGGRNPYVGKARIDIVARELAQDLIPNLDPGLVQRPSNVCRIDHPIWQRTAQGTSAGPPSHVFVLFMESYDSWPFLETFANLHLVDEGKKLAEKGIHIRNFLPGTKHSITSYQVALQGIFETKRVAQQPLPTSTVTNLKRLGYRTRSIAGYSSESGNESRYVKQQGFDEWFFAADIRATDPAPLNRVHDRDVYSFAAKHLDYDEPTFTFIRTISNHTPWSLDLKKYDCQIEDLPENLKQRTHGDLKELQQSMGHVRYSDREMGRFVRQMIARFPNSLFVITGDHFGRNHFDRNPDLYGRSSVPLILYGPNVLGQKEHFANTCGSHVDLAATIIERCAPRGFRYAAVGRDILRPRQLPFGVGLNVVIFPDCIVNLNHRTSWEPLPWLSSREITPDQATQRIARAQDLHAAYHGVGFAMANDALSRDFPTVSHDNKHDKIASQLSSNTARLISHESPAFTQEPLDEQQSHRHQKQSPGTRR